MEDEQVGVFGEFYQVRQRGDVHVAGKHHNFVFVSDAVSDRWAIVVMRGDFLYQQAVVVDDFGLRRIEGNRQIVDVERLVRARALKNAGRSLL